MTWFRNNWYIPVDPNTIVEVAGINLKEKIERRTGKAKEFYWGYNGGMDAEYNIHWWRLVENVILKDTSCYLVGTMEHSKDNGVKWRKYIKSELESLKIKFFDPTEKMFVEDLDEVSSMQERKDMLAAGKYDEVASQMKKNKII